VGTRSRICQKGWAVWVIWGGPCCYQAMSKLIIVKSMVGITLCLCVLCDYTEVQNIQCTICILPINIDVLDEYTRTLHPLFQIFSFTSLKTSNFLFDPFKIRTTRNHV